jgi:hypothetical protein
MPALTAPESAATILTGLRRKVRDACALTDTRRRRAALLRLSTSLLRAWPADLLPGAESLRGAIDAHLSDRATLGELLREVRA